MGRVSSGCSWRFGGWGRLARSGDREPRERISLRDPGLEGWERSDGRRIYCLRHGSTLLNEERRWIGRQDEPLSAAGRRQAVEAVDRLAGCFFGHVWSSPLARARMTALVVARSRGLDVIIRPDLRERGLGRLEGRRRSECSRAGWSGGEASVDFQVRTSRIFSEAFRRAPVLLVTHSGVVRSLLRVASCETDRRIGHCVPIVLTGGSEDGLRGWRVEWLE